MGYLKARSAERFGPKFGTLRNDYSAAPGLLPRGRFSFSEEVILKTPIAANDNQCPAKLLNYRELSETRGIGYSRRHLYTLENERKLPRRLVRTELAGSSRKSTAGLRNGPQRGPSESKEAAN